MVFRLSYLLKLIKQKTGFRVYLYLELKYYRLNIN